MQNTPSPDQKRRAAIAAFIFDADNFRIAQRYYFERTRLGTKGVKRAEMATLLTRLGITARELEIVKAQHVGTNR